MACSPVFNRLTKITVIIRYEDRRRNGNSRKILRNPKISCSSKSMLPYFSVDHLPVLQQSLSDTFLSRIPVITMSCIAHDLFRGSPISRSEWLIPGGGDIIIRNEGTRILRGEVTIRKTDL